MSPSLFISYAHEDMKESNWLEQLKLYLAPLRREDNIDIWDDTRLETGMKWPGEIDKALESATSAILLIGPGFMASKSINAVELPRLLDKVNLGHGRIYPLVIKYCNYRILECYQAFNDIKNPLESLSPAEQNKILNDLSCKVDDDLRHAQLPDKPPASLTIDAKSAMTDIATELQNTRIAFGAQTRLRDALVREIIRRLNVREDLEYEKFFFRYYDKLIAEEKFQFDQIRAITEGPLYHGNLRMLTVIQQNTQVLDEIPALVDVRQHLVFWLNKYERVFAKTPQMCVLYIGVEDGVPFPTGIDEMVDNWLKR